MSMMNKTGRGAPSHRRRKSAAPGAETRSQAKKYTNNLYIVRMSDAPVVTYDGTVKWDVTWDDPKVLTRPDELHTQFMLRPGTRVREYVCQENNQDPATYDVMKKAGDLHIRK